MRDDSSATRISREAVRPGTLLALAGVLSFSFTLPATTLALGGFGPWTVASGRCLVAGVLAGCCLAARRVPVPARRYWPALAVVAGGCVLGFPILTTLAVRLTTTGHSAVVIGLLPLATAVVGASRARRRESRGQSRWQSRRFWLAASVGAAAVLAFTVAQSHGAPSVADLLLFAALVVCAFRYAEGGRLAAAMPGWQVIAWALVIALPVSQLQLAQPLLTPIWSVVLLGEHLPPLAPVTAVVVLLCITVTQRDRADRPRATQRA